MIKRIITDILILIGIVALFATETYMLVPAPLQLVALKALLISVGIVHAHIVRKLLFEKVDWKEKQLTGGHYVAIVFYIVIPLCYAFGG